MNSNSFGLRGLMELVIPYSANFEATHAAALDYLNTRGIPPEQVRTFVLLSQGEMPSAQIIEDMEYGLELPPPQHVRVVVVNGGTNAQHFALTCERRGVLLHLHVQPNQVELLRHQQQGILAMRTRYGAGVLFGFADNKMTLTPGCGIYKEIEGPRNHREIGWHFYPYRTLEELDARGWQEEGLYFPSVGCDGENTGLVV